jgi:hypothetical protein
MDHNFPEARIREKSAGQWANAFQYYRELFLNYSDMWALLALHQQATRGSPSSKISAHIWLELVIVISYL